ncbi:MAG: MipA/OmpV family protein [Caulobacteraceae bacterium]|nr:MipA/OmpV family protein [Caulobacteraceae bacterium]
MKQRALGFLSLALLAAPGLAQAKGWLFTVGAQVGVSPPYEGANRDILEPAPTFDLRPADAPQRFTPPDGGTMIALYANKYFEIGPVARFRYERSDHGEFKGFKKINIAAEPGVYIDVWPVSWLRGRVEGRRGVVGHEGWVGDAGLDLVYTGKRWDASVGPRVGWGDGRYMDTYFSVTPTEAARSPFVHQAYKADGGRRYTGLETAIAYHLSKHWRVTADFGYQRLSKEAANSPIVKATGSPNQYMSSLGLSYQFGIGTR